jgi:hypothetical protein
MPTICEMFIWADEKDEIFDTYAVDDGRTEMQVDAVNFF